MIVDVFSFIGHWPFRDIPFEKSPLKWMDAAGIDRALVLAVDALFRIDALATAPRILKAAKRTPDRLFPVVPVNPSLALWQRRLEQVVRKAKPTALALFPSYHLYDVAAPETDELMNEASARGLPVLLAVRVEDRRKQHALMQVDDVPIDSVLALARRHADVPLVLLGAKNAEVAAVAESGLRNVSVEISGLELLDPPAAAVEALGADRVLFGTRAPLFISTAAVLKVEMSTLDDEAKRMILSENARRLFSLG